MRGTSGLLLISMGIVHTIYGAFMGYGVLGKIASATFASESSRQLVTGLGRQFVFWFLFGGFMMMALGHLAMWIERRIGRPAPAFLGWELLALAIIGIAMMPRSGFWLVLALAIYTLIFARRGDARTAPV